MRRSEDNAPQGRMLRRKDTFLIKSCSKIVDMIEVRDYSLVMLSPTEYSICPMPAIAIQSERFPQRCPYRGRTMDKSWGIMQEVIQKSRNIICDE